MKRKIKYNKKIYIKKYILKNRLLILVIILSMSTFMLINFISIKARPILLNYGTMELTRLASLIINKAISKQIVESTDIDDLFIITKSNNEIKTIDFNPIIVNKFLSITTNSVQLSLKQIEDGDIDFLELPEEIKVYDEKKLKEGIIFEIPSGIIFDNSLLYNILPKIPVKYNLIGNINSNVDTKVTNYGINNALLEVDLNIKLNLMILMPFISKDIVVENNIPLAIKLVEGKIPEYYFSGINRQSKTFSLPNEKK